MSSPLTNVVAMAAQEADYNPMAVDENSYSTLRRLAPQLLVLEGRWGPNNQEAGKAAQVFERLRIAFAMFAGVDGFASLIRRALALAKARDPSLRQMTVAPDGTLQGLEHASHDAFLIILEQFLELLVTFVGEPLTLRLVGFAWPDAAVDDLKDTRSFP